VRVTETGSDIEILVEDNGHGFDTDSKPEGVGLVGINERVELLDGTVKIASTPGNGTTMRARIPTRRRDAI
jgi:two-component system sensor histidine kinase DegS